MEHPFEIAILWLGLAVLDTVIASAVIPTLIANFIFMPHHLLPGRDKDKGLVAVREFGVDEE
jgi:hypothetical protein